MLSCTGTAWSRYLAVPADARWEPRCRRGWLPMTSGAPTTKVSSSSATAAVANCYLLSVTDHASRYQLLCEARSDGLPLGPVRAATDHRAPGSGGFGGISPVQRSAVTPPPLPSVIQINPVV